MPSAMIVEPPSPRKLDLIKRFLFLTGLQNKIDSGNFLHRLAAPGQKLFQAIATDRAMTFGEVLRAPLDAIEKAYAKHRPVWQEEYESHVHWEFAEDELAEIVAFFESTAGQHYLEGVWRMEAYIGTNTEDLVSEIVDEADALLNPKS